MSNSTNAPKIRVVHPYTGFVSYKTQEEIDAAREIKENVLAYLASRNAKPLRTYTSEELYP